MRSVRSGSIRRTAVLVAATAVLAALLPATSAGAAVPYDPFFAQQSTVSDFGATTRPWGVAAGDFDETSPAVDLVVGRTTGNVHFMKGNGDGTFAAPTQFAWKQAFNNAWAFASGDLNGDGNLDVVWGANALSTGCSVSPTPSTGCPLTITVNDGDVRVFYGNGNGTFQETPYFVSAVRHNAGTLLADIGTDAGSLAVGDVDGDGDQDVIAGAVDGANSTVKILKNNGVSGFSVSSLISQATACATPCSPVYFPAISTQNSPWGLALGDADADGDLDLWVGDRALYVYLYRNDGAGAFTLKTANDAVSGRPNVYLGHDTFRAAVGFTPSLASGDLNGDGKADVLLGLHSGANTPTTGCGSPSGPCANDGRLLMDVSTTGGHTGFGAVADVGTAARGVTLADFNGDANADIVTGTYEGPVKVLRQLPPLDSDSDGISDYVDNAPNHPNAGRIDMNDDGSQNNTDQLDNDFDTVLGNPENPGEWVRLGDPADDDDDNDGALDGADNCRFTPNGGQTDADDDGTGDACDPLDDRDADGDGVPNGPEPGGPLYAEHLAAKAKWASGDTHFVIRIDALGRFFQNEFTQLMTDSVSLSPEDWAVKCWQNYDGPNEAPSTSTPDPAYEPCGTGEGTASQTLTLPGGKALPVSVVTIPKQLWTDPPVIDWINDRNDSARFDLGQHGAYHDTNTGNGDWATATDGRAVFSCETCGLTEAENYELLKIGHDTLTGDYSNKWIAETGGTASSPKIDWSTSANPLISYAPPFNTSDTLSRKAVAQLGFKSFSASIHEETGYVGYPENFFSPEGSHHEQIDQFGVFHASADHEVEPPETAGGAYDPAAYAAYLESVTEDGGLNTWLIEEVEWSGRPCNDDERVTGATRAPAPVTCAEGIAMGASNNRENNTVYLPRWQGWMQLLDYVKGYEGGVAMTMGEVALAQGFDNAPTVPNPGQADADADGIGDVVDGAGLAAADTTLGRNQAGSLSATLTNGAGAAIVGQKVTFTYDADGDGTDETYEDTTGAAGVASVSVTPTRPVGASSFGVAWSGRHGLSAADTGDATVKDASSLDLDATNPTSGQFGDPVTVGATLTDTDGLPLEGRTVSFAIGTASGSGTTDATGHASATLTLPGPAGAKTLSATFVTETLHAGSSDTSSFTVTKEDTVLTMPDATAPQRGNPPVVASATLKEADGAPLPGQSVRFYVMEKVKGAKQFTLLGTATTNASGVASFTIPSNKVSKTPVGIRAEFLTTTNYVGSTDDATAFRT